MARRIISSRPEFCFDNLQGDLDSLSRYCEGLGMSVNEEKCCVMHCGRDNPRSAYSLMNNVLLISEREKEIWA